MQKKNLILVVLLASTLCGCSNGADPAIYTVSETYVTLETVEMQAPVQSVLEPILAITEPAKTTPDTTIMSTEAVDDVYAIVDEYVYAICDVNIRSGPGTEYSVLDYLSEGDEIYRIAIGTDGWSRVYFEGDDAYIRSKYLSHEKPKEKVESEAAEMTSQDEVRPTQPDEENYLSDEDMVEAVPELTSPTLAETEPAVLQEPMVQPTEVPSCVEPEKINATDLAAYGNSFAASLGFAIDHSVRDGYFPPDTVCFSTMSAAYSNVKENVLVLYNNIIARDGSIDGYRCCVTVSDNGDGTYTTTVYYG